ncbi:ATP-binding protein [Burkholderia diffusa]|uniref:histidine kinase n=1 Tax=Burkholderia diffusa TaxID=488732 RepID=A0A6P2KN90_9BURK|nr:ATP-binding protein [Burkholderia diffusa]KAB0657211.1 two-component sensor histidine kinase [Burkholderia diffusa]MBM2654348.1 sensor histidine kinase N-terminal domain-containing protein [Burkholderia diffusa]VWB58313.1 integral membrane sensor signal transduction histidine kinase [Burkholderia diffusa]
MKTLLPARSLHGRLLTLVPAVVLGVWLSTLMLTWLDAQREIDRLLDGHLAQAAALLVAQQARGPDDDDNAIDAPILHPYGPRVAFQVFHDGRLGLHSENAPAKPMVAPELTGRDRASGFWTVVIDGNAWRVFVVHGVRSDVQVFVGERIDSRESILRAVMRSAFWPMAAALPLLVLAIGWAVRRGTAPLRDFGRVLARRNPQALDPIRPDRTPLEMRSMLDALNRLFERIRTVMDAERRFTADAAHELRTPIAAVKAQAQVAMAEPDDERRRHALRGVLEGCDRAARLVDQLLLLSRLDAGALTERAPVDVSALAKRVVAEAAPRSIGKRQRLELDAPSPCVVGGNEPLLESMVRNLVDNAIGYSPPQAHISVSVCRREGHTVLRVEDGGPGIGDDDLHRLGERFFRPQGARPGGSGLGWSIVRRIAAAHDADIEVGRSPALGGLRVVVSWPVADATDAATH